MTGKKTKINYETSDDDENVLVEKKYPKTHKTFFEEIESKKEKQIKKTTPPKTVPCALKLTSSKEKVNMSNNTENLIEMPDAEIYLESEVNECFENSVDDELIENLRNSSFDESFEFKTQDKR